MILRRTSYVAVSPIGGSKRKIALLWNRVCYKVFCVKTVSDKVVRHLSTYVRVQK